MKILIADDDLITLRVLERCLIEAGYEPILAIDGTTALEILEDRDSPQVAILDWDMPGIDGIEVCRRIRERSASRFYYLMVLTGRMTRKGIRAGIEAGADDYLGKPLDAHELHVRLRAAARIVAFQEVMQHQTSKDALTGVWNRKAICEVLGRQLSRAWQARSPLALVMADIDHFKQVNDEYDYPFGDAVLREVASRLKNGLRPGDSIGRYGGEEFMLVLPECSSPNAVAFCDRLREQIANQPIVVRRHSITVTLSMGVAIFPSMADTLEDLVSTAENALYRAKESGRNCVKSAFRRPDMVPLLSQ